MKLSFRFAGALFAAVATLETLCTLCGAALFNSIYPLFLRVGFNGFSFLVMAVLMLAALTITEYVVTCFYKLTELLKLFLSNSQAIRSKNTSNGKLFSRCPKFVPRVLSFPSPLSRSRGREGEDPGNEVDVVACFAPATYACLLLFSVVHDWPATKFTWQSTVQTWNIFIPAKSIFSFLLPSNFVYLPSIKWAPIIPFIIVINENTISIKLSRPFNFRHKINDNSLRLIDLIYLIGYH